MAFSIHETLVIELQDVGSASESEATQLRAATDPPTPPAPTAPRPSVAPGTSALHAAQSSRAATTVEDFVGRLVQSRLFTAEQMAAVVSSVTPSDHPRPATPFARRLVSDGVLTDYQAAVLLHGSPQPLALDEFRILEIAGAGGIATLYKAERLRNREVVALKVRNAGAADSQGQWSVRFRREGQAMQMVSHPNVVRAFASVHRDDCDYFVLEYLPGPNLEELVRRRQQLTLGEALGFVSDAARGLAACHARGLVHRDVKPSNLLLDASEMVKLADFGLVRFDEREAQRLDLPSDDLLTKTGTLMGTPHYMAPEQALDARTADQRSDIYSLGCTLFFLLTGRPPYHGDSVMSTLQAHQNAAIPLLDRFRADVPAGVQRIFARMIAKQPNDRYARLDEMLADLAEFTGEPRSTLPLDSGAKRRWWHAWSPWKAA